MATTHATGFVIEAGIPAPPANGRTRYPFPDMKVGDSFVVTEGRSSAQSAAHAWGKVHARKFRCRAIGDGMRIWRVA